MLKRVIRHLYSGTLVSAVTKKVNKMVEPLLDSKFIKLKAEANGMLSPAVYKKIYKTIYRLPDLDIIEIGGASGAGSIAAAWAMQVSGKKSKLIVVERCEGGSREKYGDKEDNLQLIMNNFKQFGVTEQVVLFPHEISYENSHEVLNLIKTDQVAAIILDADGNIDRDFYHFYPRLITGGAIIVDDYDKEDTIKPYSTHPNTGLSKKKFIYRLLNQFIDWGLVKKSSLIDNTFFGYKPPGGDFSLFSLEECKKIRQKEIEKRKRYSSAGDSRGE